MVDVIEDEYQRCRARCSEKARWYSIKAAGLGFPRILAADAAATPRESIILVDCRTAAEQAVGIIPNAINRKTFESNYMTPTKVPAGVIIAPYCTIGYRSGQFAVALTKRGFRDVRNHEGVSGLEFSPSQICQACLLYSI